MRRKSMKEAACPIARSLDVIGDWWSLLIVRDALRGARRFSEFQKNLGVSKNILTLRLRALVAQGILESVPAPDGAYQHYVLTAKGRGLFPVLVALREWGEDHLFEPGQCATRLIDRQNGQPVARLELRTQDGRRLGLQDTLLQHRPR